MATTNLNLDNVASDSHLNAFPAVFNANMQKIDTAFGVLSSQQQASAAAANAYVKPSGGIPLSDLASAVQVSLGKADNAYTKPSGGIPLSDLASSVQVSLGKADSALQSVPGTYRTAADQDAIDSGKASASDVNGKMSALAAVLTQLKTLIQSLAYTSSSHNGAATASAIDTALSVLGGGSIPVITTYTVTKALTNCSISNNAGSAASGSAYSAAISADSGYALGAVTVTMGGVNITASAYSNGTVSIASVTGNIVITAAAERITYTVTNTLSNCASSNAAASANHGSSYSAAITANTGYTLDAVTVTMGGVDITSSAYSNGAVSIASVTGNIVITASAAAEGTSYSVTNTLTNCSNSNSAVSAAENAAYSGTLTANTGYTLGTVTVTMGGVDITSSAYSNGVISIAAVTGNIVITASAAANTYTVSNTLSHCANSNSAVSATHGSSYSGTVTADSGYTLSSVTVTMGGVNVTSSAYNSSTGVISIASVTGNIAIVCSASAQPVETTLFSNKTATAKFSMKSVYADLLGGDYFEATMDCTNVDSSGSGKHVFNIGEMGMAAYGSNSNSVTIFWRSNKCLVRYKTAGGEYTTVTEDKWVTVQNNTFTVRLDGDGLKVDGSLKIASSKMTQMMGVTRWEIGGSGDGCVNTYYSYIKVGNQPSANDTVIQRNYAPSGNFAQNVTANLANGDCIEINIDCTNCSVGDQVLTIGERGKTGSDSNINAIRVIYNGASSAYSIQYRVNGGNYTTVSMDTTTVKYPQVALRLDAEGFKANGVTSASVKVAAADMGQTIGITDWEIDGLSSAYYPLIIVRNESN